MIDERVERLEGGICAHDVCRCTVTGPIEAGAYCSDFCREMDNSDIESEQCACGHPACDTPP